MTPPSLNTVDSRGLGAQAATAMSYDVWRELLNLRAGPFGRLRGLAGLAGS